MLRDFRASTPTINRTGGHSLALGSAVFDVDPLVREQAATDRSAHGGRGSVGS